MIGSLIAGWILFAVGLVIYGVSIWARIRKMLGAGEEESLAVIKETAEALAELAEAFSKFSEEMQFLLLGTGCLIGGIYLLQNRPF
jgi:hypothetical protein